MGDEGTDFCLSQLAVDLVLGGDLCSRRARHCPENKFDTSTLLRRTTTMIGLMPSPWFIPESGFRMEKDDEENKSE